MLALYLLFIVSILSIVGVKGNYSIDTLLNFLQHKGYYDIIFQIKLSFGDDVAISVCRSFIATFQCEEVVRVYMIRHGARGEDEICIPIEEKLSPESKTIYSKFVFPSDKKALAICILYNYDILIQTMNENEITELIEKATGRKPITPLSNKELELELKQY